MLNYNLNIKVILFCFIIIIPFSNLFAGGPWVKQKGKFYIKLSEWWIVFDEHYTDTGLLDPNITTGVFNTSLYAEYGISNRITGLFNGALVSRNYMNNLKSNTTQEILIKGEGINAIGDIDLGIKYGITKPGSKINMSTSLILGLPTGVTNKGEFGNLQTGDGEFNQMIQIDVGKGFKIKEASAYISLYSAVNHRSNGYSEEFRYGVELGVGLFSNRLWLNTKLNGNVSFKNGDTAETITSTSIFANNAEFTSVAFEANYYINKKIGVSAGYATAVAGKIIAAAPSYSVGVFYDFN